MFAEHSRSITTKGDVNLIVGTYMLPEVFPALDDVFAADAKILHIDLNAYEIAKNHPVTLGLVSDPKLTLAHLAAHIERLQDDRARGQASRRFDAITLAKREASEKAFEQDATVQNHEPLHMSRFMDEFRKHVPADCIMFDEALTNSPAVTRYMPPTQPGQFFQTRGGSLGVGIPGAIGAKLARPEKPVFGFTGDGGAMYTIQALWTAARHNVDAKFIICNNRSYRLLQLNIAEYWKEQRIAPHEFPVSFDLSKPEIRFDEMARSMGVPAARIERLDQIEPAIRQALATTGPFLLEVVLEGDVRPDLIGVRCGQ
jgi:benzoylformate decarboxylase